MFQLLIILTNYVLSTDKSAQSSVAGSKRSTPAASAANSRSTSFSSVADKPAEPIANPVTPSQRRYGFLALNYLTLDDGRTFKQFLTDLYPISDKIWDADSLIPTAPDSDWILVGHPAIRQAKLPRVIRRRGADNYCDGRPCRMFDTGQFSWDTLSGSVHAGRSCICHAPVTHLAADKYHISPRNWATTPAEADLEPSRPRKVRFLGDDKDGFLTPVTKISTFERWYNTAWPASAEENHSWTLDEDLAIDLLLHPFFGEPEPTMEPQDDTTTSEKEAEARPKDDLDAIWGSAMATKFDDESDSESECNDSARPEDRDADDKAKLLAKFSEDISSDDEFF